MPRILPTFIALMISMSALAEEAKKDTTHYGWKHALVAQLVLTQTSYTDWSQGGDNALSYTFNTEGREINDQPNDNWATWYKFAFGQARLDALGMRKTDDQMNLESIYTWKLDAYVNPYAAVTFKSQFSTGYTYAKDGTRTAVSDLFDPAYFTEGVGAGYQPIKEVKTRLGFALREILTKQYNNYASDPSKPGVVQKTDVEGGLQLGVEVNWAFYDNMIFTSKLDLFQPISKLDRVIVHWDNTLAMKVNRFISINASSSVINEQAVSPYTQIKETIGLALGYDFF
jgi:hypothetical protein